MTDDEFYDYETSNECDSECEDDICQKDYDEILLSSNFPEKSFCLRKIIY